MNLALIHLPSALADGNKNGIRQLADQSVPKE